MQPQPAIRVSAEHRALLLLLAALAIGCSEIEGHVVKGPVARATLHAHRVDPTVAGLAGRLLSEATTDYDGSMDGLVVPLAGTGPVLVISEGGTDLSTHAEPVLPRLRTLVVRGNPSFAEPLYATPLTTLTLELAGLIADLDVGLYRGDDDGQVTVGEFLEAVEIAEQMVRQAFGLGQLEDLNLFTSPPVLLESSETEAQQASVLAHRVALEAFTAYLVALLDVTPDPTGELTPEAILAALAKDLADGSFDAAFFGDPIAALPDPATLVQILTMDPSGLLIPNTSMLISELGVQFRREAGVTAPALIFDWRELVVGPLGPVVLLIDADGDGVADPQDVFPTDPDEWADTDGDGIGDNADFYPTNAACWAEHDGDGADCLIHLLVGQPVRQIVAGEGGVLYILLDSEARILRFDSFEGHFLAPIELNGAVPRNIAYSKSHGRLYLSYVDTSITYVDPDQSLSEVAFASTDLAIYGLAAVGNYVLAQDYSGAWESHYVFDRDGYRTDWEEWNHYSRVYAWNEANSRVYFFRDGTSPNDLMWEEVDQSTGVITSEGESPYHGDFVIRPPITVSGDGLHVMLGSGDIYDANTLLLDGSIPTGQSHAVWPVGSGPITLAPLGTGRTLLERRDAAWEVAEYLVYDGEPLGLFDLGGRLFVILETDTQWRFVEYVPSDDSDGDGVSNADDAFPLDPAASTDSDRDGHPDAWNPGAGPDDSTEGLVLDAFPFDSACQLSEHGLPDQPDVCDVVGQIPIYDPTRVVADDAGVVYLLSPENRRIFRWSSDTGDHLNPLVVGATGLPELPAPTQLAWSSSHERLYLGYPTGALTYISPTVGIEERSFAATAQSVHGLASVGNYLLAQDNSGAWESHYIFDRDGDRTDWEEWNHYSREYAWSATNSRVYFFRDGSSPNDLMWEEVDQSAGVITSDGESPYHGHFAILPPIRVSLDGTRVLLGSGDVYDGSSLEVVGAVPVILTDAVWLADGSLVTIRDSGDGRTLLEQWSADLTLYNVQYYDGAPLRILTTAEAIVVITHDGSQPAFGFYVPTDDGDGDGVLNVDDAFPLDPAASMDSDGDGYPDAWNPGMGPEDSTEGLVLDAFPFDSACQLPEHGLPDQPDVCDVAHGIPSYEPEQIVSDEDGIVYLLSSENDRIFRWSVDANYHLNPIFVSESPRHIAHSSEYDRLYLGYASGAITQIDLDDPAFEEHPFAALAESVTALQTAGAFVFASDPSGSRNTHSTFDADGVRISSIDRSYSSARPVWSAPNSRMYHFRSGISPNDLLYREIDPATGALGAAGETPYHGTYLIREPIRVSPDGTRVLLGSGDIYDAITMQHVDSLPIEFTDGAWLADGSLVTVRESGDGRTLLEQWSADLTLYNLQYYDGTPLRILTTADAIVVITHDGSQPSFDFYVPTDDADGDGVANEDDAFLLDPAASLDTDGDGYPDAWNPGMGPEDSTEGLVLDAFPFDSACQLPEHGLPDQPDVCDIGGQIPVYDPTRVAADDDGVVYLLSRENNRIFRWSTTAMTHLNPLFVDANALRLAYSAENDRLYVGYDSGGITQFDLVDPAPVERNFASTNGGVRALEAAGGFVYAIEVNGSQRFHGTFAPDASRISTERAPVIGEETAWSDPNARLYVVQSSGSPRDLHYIEVDPTTGVIGASGETPYHGDFIILPPVRVSIDGTRVLLGSGDVYDGVTMEIVTSLPVRPVDALWLDDGSVVTIREYGDYSTLLEHWNPDSHLANVQLFEGRPRRVVRTGGQVVVVTRLDHDHNDHYHGYVDTPEDHRPAFGTYVPGSDGDGDGVPFDADAFPLDPAASQDSDGDGYPDAWNAGMGPADSTQGLALDAFPNDSACQLPEHGLPGDPTTCDIGGSIPAYEPLEIVADTSGVVYLLGGAHDRIFRWSSVDEMHLNPIFVGQDPKHLAYSAANDRLYVAYDSGQITQIDLADPGFREQPFASTPDRTVGLQTAGPFVFAIDPSGAWYSHYTFAPDGSPISAVDWNRLSISITWSAANSRMYFFRNGTSPNDLHYEDIDPVSGEITGGGETPYHGQYSIVPPIRVSVDGSLVLLGSGDLYDGITLEYVDAMSIQPADALWRSDGYLVTIRAIGDGDSWLEHWDSGRRVLERRVFAGEPRRVLRTMGSNVVVTQLDDRPEFAIYVPNDDSDGDGVDNVEDAFPLDPSASIDSDGDGYPDAWNPGMGPGDSMEGLVLDAFPDDSACQLAEHGIGGVCDFAYVLPPSESEPICETDAARARGSNGYIELGETGDFVPLCDGWLIIAETQKDRVAIRNVIDGREAAIFELDGAPGDLEFDEAAKLLYVAFPDRSVLGVIDLITGAVTTIAVPVRIHDLALDSVGGLFMVSQTPSRGRTHWLPPGSNSPAGPWWISGFEIEYNTVTQELVSIGEYDDRVYRYAFDPSTGPTQIEFASCGNAADLAVSRDGAHVAVASGGGNGNGYTIFDYDASDLANVRGEWVVGAWPSGVEFDRAGEKVVATNRYDFIVFDVDDFTEIYRQTPFYCSYRDGDRVGFSRGGTIAFGQMHCGFNDEVTHLYWFVP